MRNSFDRLTAETATLGLDLCGQIEDHRDDPETLARVQLLRLSLRDLREHYG